MLRVSRDIDTLSIGIWQTESLIGSQPVLDAQYAEHRWRGEMAADDVTSQPAWEWMRCWSLTVEHRIVILLGTLDILIPPHAQSRHIMARDGTYRAVWVTAQMSELNRWILWHALEFQTQYLQLVHYPRHTVWHHTEVFGTNQHAGSLNQFRQLFHRLLIPELVVAAIEIVVVKAVERCLVIIIERLVDKVKLG